jgi:hypothetical protein
MSHPMEGYYDGEHSISDRRWARIHAMRERLANTWLSSLTADYAYDVCVVMNPDIVGEFCQGSKVDQALDRLEARLG